MRVIEGLVMPGGWHYEQPLDSGQKQRIEGRTYRELLERILLFRLQHIELISSGTATKEQVQLDVTAWICSRWPTTCTGPRGDFPFKPVEAVRLYSNPTNAIEDWFKTLSKHELDWLDQATANRRARICMQCPLNQRWETNCGACNTNVRTRSLLLRGSHKSGFENQLKACLAYGWLNEVAIWLRDGFVSQPRRNPPADCWKAKEHEKAEMLV